MGFGVAWKARVFSRLSRGYREPPGGNGHHVALRRTSFVLGESPQKHRHDNKNAHQRDCMVRDEPPRHRGDSKHSNHDHRHHDKPNEPIDRRTFPLHNPQFRRGRRDVKVARTRSVPRTAVTPGCTRGGRGEFSDDSPSEPLPQSQRGDGERTIAHAAEAAGPPTPNSTAQARRNDVVALVCVTDVDRDLPERGIPCA